MIRLFKQHNIRTQTELDGLWDFTPITEQEPFELEYKYRLPVPGCWEMCPDLINYRGKGIYRRLIDVDETCALKFDFKGISHTGDVYLDGRHIGHHYNAYTPFIVTVPDVEKGRHELKIAVDNSFSQDSALHIPNDYYTYGGLIRPVTMEKVPSTYIKRVEFTPFISNSIWKARIIIYMANISRAAKETHVKAYIDTKILDFGIINLDAGKSEKVTNTFDFEDIIPWTHENPRLYLLDVQLHEKNVEKPYDDYIERVGFRTVDIKGNSVYVNGERISLKGYNRHEDHPTFGASIPFEMMMKDIYLVEQSGANSIRTCHYPNDELFIDICDERGIYVWEENHARGLNEKDMQNSNFTRQCKDCIDEMVKTHYNHPSIVMWGILNECESSTTTGKTHYEMQFNQIRNLDESRPLTFASNKWFTDICLDLVDIVSFNIYSLWYSDEDPLQHLNRLKEWIDTTPGKGKPLIVSEFGAGAISGLRDSRRVKWTEEGQVDILDANLRVYLNTEDIAGVFIWQFCDCRVTEEKWAMRRPGCKNNKGIFDGFRQPKLAYKTVKDHFTNS